MKASKTFKFISKEIEKQLSYTNGWRISDEDYKTHCDILAEKIMGHINRHYKPLKK